MSITLRFAQDGDAAALLLIYTPYIVHSTASWEYEPPTQAEFSARIAACRAAGFPWLVAYENGQILGYAYASRYAQRAGYSWSCDTTIYIAENAHRRGVASLLYTALLRLLTAQGYVNAYALVTSPNEASEAFHAAMGFALAARIPHMGYKHGRWLGLSTFCRPLCPPPAQPAPPVAVQALDESFVRAVLCGAAAENFGGKAQENKL